MLKEEENGYSYDIGELTEFYQNDPVAFEKKIEKLILSLICSAPKKMQRDLARLQFKICFATFSHEYWSMLQQNNPELFEVKRRLLVRLLILTVEEGRRKKMEHLQCKVDLVRSSCKNPLQSFLKLQDMMWEIFYCEGGFLDQIHVLEGVAKGFEKKLKDDEKPKLKLLKS